MPAGQRKREKKRWRRRWRRRLSSSSHSKTRKCTIIELTNHRTWQESQLELYVKCGLHSSRTGTGTSRRTNEHEPSKLRFFKFMHIFFCFFHSAAAAAAASAARATVELESTYSHLSCSLSSPRAHRLEQGPSPAGANLQPTEGAGDSLRCQACSLAGLAI